MFGLVCIKKILEVSSKKCLKYSIKNASYLSAAKTSVDRRYMILDINRIEDNSKSEEFKYPLSWLRDNCQCSICFHAQSKSRIIDWSNFKFENTQPKSIQVRSTNICFVKFPSSDVNIVNILNILNKFN